MLARARRLANTCNAGRIHCVHRRFSDASGGKPRRRFNFAPAIELEPDAKKALTLLSGMKDGAIGVRAAYVPVNFDMKFSFDFLFDDEKQHRFDEVIPLDGRSRAKYQACFVSRL